MIIFKSLTKSIKYSLITLISLIVISVITISILLFSHQGNEIVIATAKKIEPRLSLELEDGTFLNSPTFTDISWHDGETLVDINQVNYEFNWGCLFDGVCLESFNVDGVRIALPESNEAEEPEVAEADSGPLDIDIPISLIIKSFTITDVNFTLGKLGVNLDKISAQAKAFKKDASLSSQLSGLTITLPDNVPQVITQKPNNSSKKTLDLNIQSISALLNKETLPTINLPINLTVSPISVDRVKVVQNAQTIFALNHLETQFTFKKTELQITQFSLDIPETKADLTASINFINDYPLTLTIDGQLKNIKQLQPETLLQGVKYDFKTQGSLSDLNSELKLSNKIDLQLRSHLNLFADNFPHQITLDWQNLQWPLTGKAQYSAKKGHFASSGSLLKYNVELQSDYKIGEIPEGIVNFKSHGDLKHLQVEGLDVKTLSGDINLSGLLSWKEKINWLGELIITDIDLASLDSKYDGHFSGNIKQQAAVTLFEQHPPEWQFNIPKLDVAGELLSRPLTVSGHLSGSDKEGIIVDKLTVNNAENSLIVNGRLSEKNDLNIALNLVDLSHLMLGLKGAVVGNISMTGPAKQLQIGSNLVANNLTYEAYQVGNIRLDSDVTLAEKPEITLNFVAKNIIASEQKIDDLTVEITHSRDLELLVPGKKTPTSAVRHRINFLANSELASTDLTAYLTQINDQLSLQLNNAKIVLPYQALTLMTPFEVTSQPNKIEITPHCWQASTSNSNNAGSLCIQEVNIGEDGNVLFNIDRYLLANLTPLLPSHLKIAGALSAKADLHWKKNTNPIFALDLFSDDMVLKISSDAAPTTYNDYAMESFKINLKGQENDVLVDAKIYAEKLIDIEVNGELQPYNKQPSVDAKIISKLPDFSLFLPIIPSLDALTGQLGSEMLITGHLANPTVNGSINIRNGLIGSPNLPMNISELSADVVIAKSSATLQGSFNSNGNNTTVDKAASIPLLTSTLNLFDKSVKKVGGTILDPLVSHEEVQQVAKENPGIAYITGQFDWSKTFMGEIHFYAQQLEIYDYGKVDLFITPDITVSISDKIKVDGNLHVDKGKIVVKELAAGAVSESSDVVIVDVKQKTVSSNLPLVIDLSVDMGHSLRIVALGLDTFIKGKLLIEKPLEKDLSVNGVLHLSEGSYRALGQQLMLRDSRIIFQGAPDSPYLQIEAIRDPSKIEDDVIAGVRVTGPVDELELVIFSEPGMAQQEALSYLTRGQGLNSSSDGGTMANMLIDIAAGQSDNLMSSIGEEFGIKDLTLASSGTGDEQSVGVRGEIAPGVEVSYGVGVFDTFSILSLRYEILERLYIEASSGIYQAIDAYYEWDWDKRE